ncbi:hypothetical protein KC19_8G122800 [Ceratodon purpureus]|uniref:Aminotransferase class I/classII large domain-containing protein n=1 Tax=Ceratodon purpureus TaxID=3225 RepID=A0A8T0H646_CERPU|nr:hypothetical protein KC19_8G122800 [Ceratodon purpureus]
MLLQLFEDVVRGVRGEEEVEREVRGVSSMGLIVPLQGMLGGRYGLALGCIIPLASFYFIQLRPKRINLPLPKPAQVKAQAVEPVDVQAPISERALAVIAAKDSPYGMGLKEMTENGYDLVVNPTGCIDLGTSENKLSLDLLQEWLSKWGDNLLDLSENAGYVDFSGLKSFKIVLARFMGMVMGGRVKFEPSQMVLTAGATPTTEILAFSLAQPGEAFLIPSPYYSGFDRDIKWRSQVQLIPIPCGSDTDFKLTSGVLESTFRNISRKGIKIRGILISNPSNPVGSLLDRAALTSLLSFTQDKKIHLLIDEIYAACTYEGCTFTSIAEILDTQKYNRSYVHVIYGLSKDLGLAGFRVGVLYSWNTQVLEAASRMARHCAVSTATQQLCTSLLSDEQFMNMFLFENRRRLTKRYRKVVTELQKVGIGSVKSMGGLFCWIDLRHVLRSSSKDEEMKLWKHLLYKVGLHLTPGTSCWCEEPGWYRFCFATVDDETLLVAFLRFRKFMQNPVY